VRTEAGAEYCPAHSAEQERLLSQPWRAGYYDPAYLRNRELAWKRAAGHCEVCGIPIARAAAECDHIVPLRDGGTNLIENLRWECVTCHRKKTRLDRRRRAG
jgi:5-methylcytosine-specific restriction endonuclease McrA